MNYCVDVFLRLFYGPETIFLPPSPLSDYPVIGTCGEHVGLSVGATPPARETVLAMPPARVETVGDRMRAPDQSRTRLQLDTIPGHSGKVLDRQWRLPEHLLSSVRAALKRVTCSAPSPTALWSHLY